MLYHTVKDHLQRHVPVLSSRPTGSLWDFVPEPPRRTEGDNSQPHETSVADPANADIKQEEGEEVPNQESEDVGSQWVEQMMTASDAPMPLKSKVANFVVALLAITLAIVASHGPLLQTPLQFNSSENQ